MFGMGYVGKGFCPHTAMARGRVRVRIEVMVRVMFGVSLVMEVVSPEGLSPGVSFLRVSFGLQTKHTFMDFLRKWGISRALIRKSSFLMY